MKLHTIAYQSLVGCSLVTVLMSSTPLQSATTTCEASNVQRHSRLGQEIWLNRLVECARLGNAQAQLALGRSLLAANANPANPRQSVHWLRLAAKQGLAQAQFELALMYLDGNGVEQNRYIAMDWLRLAAQQGHQQALFVRDHLLNDDFGIGC